MKNAIIYTRVSTDEQAERGFSLRDQELRLRQYCLIKGINVMAHFQDDHSAKSFDRPEFKKLLLYVKQKKNTVNVLLFIKWDRFSRNAGDSYEMINRLNRLGIEPQAIEQPIDLNIPENKIMLAFYLAAPEVENDRRSLNTIRGMRRAKKEGRYCAPAPIGYLNKRDEYNKPIIVPGPKASLITEAFEKMATGVYTQNQLRLELNKKGLGSAKNSFSKMLRNPAYIGKIMIPAYKDEEAELVKGLHDPLVNENLFYKVQDIINTKSVNRRKPQIVSENLVMRGFMKCPECGKKMTGSSSKGRSKYYHYYHCSLGCDFRISAPKINRQIEEFFENLQLKPGIKELAISMAREQFNKNSQNSSDDKSKIRKEIEGHKQRISSLQEKLMDDLISTEDYSEMKESCDREIRNLTNSLVEHKYEQSQFEEYLNCTGNLLENIGIHYKSAEAEIKQRYIGSIFTDFLEIENQFCPKRF